MAQLDFSACSTGRVSESCAAPLQKRSREPLDFISAHIRQRAVSFRSKIFPLFTFPMLGLNALGSRSSRFFSKIEESSRLVTTFIFPFSRTSRLALGLLAL